MTPHGGLFHLVMCIAFGLLAWRPFRIESWVWRTVFIITSIELVYWISAFILIWRQS